MKWNKMISDHEPTPCDICKVKTKKSYFYNSDPNNADETRYLVAIRCVDQNTTLYHEYDKEGRLIAVEVKSIANDS